MLIVKKMNISGSSVLPILEGGKGIGVSNGVTAGHFAKAGAVGCFSGVSPDFYDDNGNYIPQEYEDNLTRKERFEKLVKYAIRGAVEQAKIAWDISGGNGRIHMNVLWESGGAKRVIEGTLARTRNMIHGVVSGAGLPYDLAEIASKYKVYYYPIVSSARAFGVLWKRAYHKLSDFLGGVIYEDPWVAGGHVGLSNRDLPDAPQDAYSKLVELRQLLTKLGLSETPIVLAGGVWNLSEHADLIDNKEIGNLAFQLGSRPLLTQESPISNNWKQKLLHLKADDIVLNYFSPTGLPSIAVRNDFLKELEARSLRQVKFSTTPTSEFTHNLKNSRGRGIFVTAEDYKNICEWQSQGYDTFTKTPDNTVIFISKDKANKIMQARAECVGCLSQCFFSGWSEKSEDNTTGRYPDPRSFCIRKTLSDALHTPDIDHNLMFAGKNAYRFAQDPLYKNGYVPTIAELVSAISKGK